MHQENLRSKMSSKKFSCELCNRTFASSHNYNQHVRAHENANESCPFCNKNFRALKDHIKNVHREHQFQCGFEGCGKSFAKRHGLDRHLRTHSDDFKSIQCPECLRMFAEKVQLERHYLVHLKPEKRTNFQCSECQKYFNRKADLTRHIKTIHKEKLFSCDLCPSRRFGTKFEVLKHFNVLHLGVKSKRRNPPKKLSIDKIMSKHFYANTLDIADISEEVSSALVEVPMINFEPVEEESCDEVVEYLSDDLESTFEEEISAENSETEVREKIVLWECQRCNRTFENCNRLKLHNLRNHNWKCLKCSNSKNELTTFHRREDFELHWIRNHDENIPRGKIECARCLDLFANIAALHLHQKIEHGIQIKRRV